MRLALAQRQRLIRSDAILPLSDFVARWAQDLPEARPAVIEHGIREILAASPPAAFCSLAHSPGLQRLLADLVVEISVAGCNSATLAQTAQSPTARAFQAVYRQIEDRLHARGLYLPHERLEQAARRIRKAMHPWSCIYIEGFAALSRAEMALVEALARSTQLVIALPEWEGARFAADQLRALGFLSSCYGEEQPRSESVLVPCLTAAEEAEEIARRIVTLAGQGRRFSDIGVVVRRQDPYGSLLASAFVRFSIPARFYFPQPLAAHALAKYLRQCAAAIEKGWDYEATLPLLCSPLSGLGASGEADRLDFLMRSRMPARGLPTLEQPSPTLAAWLRAASELTPLSSARLLPVQWAAELARLRSLVQWPEVCDGVSHDQALHWRELAAGLRAWDQALQDAAALAESADAIPLADFLRRLDLVLAHTRWTPADGRFNAVHVLDAEEASRWRLPVLFLCGLVEGNFPQHHPQHPVLNDEERRALGRQGVHLMTAALRRQYETVLFEQITRRAGRLLVLSYPTAAVGAAPSIPSPFLSAFENERPLRREAPVRSAPAPDIPALETSALAKPNVSAGGAVSVLSPTQIESYLQCPFLFYARHLLNLNGPPAPPGQRLDALFEGSVIHRALAEHARNPGPIGPIVDRVFAEACSEHSVPQGFRAEKLRLELQSDLERLLSHPLPPAGHKLLACELDFELELDASLRLRGVIDRVIELPGHGLVVIDYKYSRPSGVRRLIAAHEEGSAVQAGLYLWAATKLFDKPPAGMLYCGLRGEVSWDGWLLPASGWQTAGRLCQAAELRARIELAKRAAVQAAGSIRQGIFNPAPRDEKLCRRCEFRDACRVETVRTPAAIAQGVGAR